MSYIQSTKASWWSISITVLASLLLFTPFVVVNSFFFPFVSGKGFAFRIIAEAIFCVWLVGCVFDARLRPRLNSGIIILTLFIISLLVSDLLSPDIKKSIWSNYERMEGWVTWSHIWMLIVALVYGIPKKLWPYVLNTSVAVSLLVAFYGFLQLQGVITINQGGVRVDGPFGNAAYFAVYLLVHAFLATFLLLRTRFTELKIYYGVVILSQIIILYHTATRGAILGFLVGAFVSAVLLVIGEWKNTKVRWWAVGVGGALLLIVLGFFAIRNTSFVRESPVLNRFASISVSEQTTSARFMVWGIAWQGFLEKPFLGWGQESFNYVFNKYYKPEMYAQEQWFDRAHNIFFDWLVSSGIIGLTLYLLLAVYIAWSLIKKLIGREISHVEKRDASIMLGLFAAYFFHNLFVFDSIFSYVLIAIIASYLIRQEVEDSKQNNEILAKPFYTYEFGAGTAYAISIAFGALFIVSIYAVNIKPIRANMLLLDSFPTATRDFAPEKIKQAILLDTFGTTEIREQLVQGVVNRIASNKIEKSQLEQEYSLARSEAILEAARVPFNARTQVMAGYLFRTAGELTLAEQYINKALELSPKKQAIMFEQGNILLMQGRKEDGLKVFKQAYDLAPAYEEATVAYFSALLSAGKTDDAKAIYSQISNSRKISDSRINSILQKYGWFEESIVLLKMRVEYIKQTDTDKKAEELMNTYAGLAYAYFLAGKRALADQAVSDATMINPSYKTQIEEWYKNLISNK